MRKDWSQQKVWPYYVPHKDTHYIHDERTAATEERNLFYRANHVRLNPKRWPGGFHHLGLHWSQMFKILPAHLYEEGVHRVVHLKYGPGYIYCLRKVKRGRRFIWILSYHHEGHCPGCKVPILKRRRKPIPQKPILKRRVKLQTRNEPPE